MYSELDRRTTSETRPPPPPPVLFETRPYRSTHVPAPSPIRNSTDEPRPGRVRSKAVRGAGSPLRIKDEVRSGPVPNPTRPRAGRIRNLTAPRPVPVPFGTRPATTNGPAPDPRPSLPKYSFKGRPASPQRRPRATPGSRLPTFTTIGRGSGGIGPRARSRSRRGLLRPSLPKYSRRPRLSTTGAGRGLRALTLFPDAAAFYFI